MMKRVKRISVVGLGKLGSPMAACFASKGYWVIGAEVDSQKVEWINRGIAPVFEPQLQDYINRSGNRLTATQDTVSAVMQSDITFVIVPTPSDVEGGFSLRHILPACESIGLAIRKKNSFHVVVITSTVMPGATGSAICSTLEQLSGKRCGEGFGLCYSPEFIALGSVIQNYLHPDFVLIGESDRHSGDILESIYKTVCENDPPFARMNFINAELTKISLNSYVTMKITFANTLAKFCQSIPDANVDVVTSALGMDNRIGPKYLKGAIGFGGPCFPRDNRAVARLAERLNVPASLSQATDRLNSQEAEKLGEQIVCQLPPHGTVSILGLSYKPNTDVIEESQGMLVAQYLVERGFSIFVYDSCARENAQRVMKKWNQDTQIHFADTVEECVTQSDGVVITLPTDEFQTVEQILKKSVSKPYFVIDCWRILDPRQLDPNIDYIGIGVGPKTTASCDAKDPQPEGLSQTSSNSLDFEPSVQNKIR